eukprot:GHVN01071688.1.p1 GENE.GHVN01071688.1~~GHVN01071688.1.p1  ORF type:complete len:242 (-),score=50.12 GHVN01071688.1:238-963(-)
MSDSDSDKAPLGGREEDDEITHRTVAARPTRARKQVQRPNQASLSQSESDAAAEEESDGDAPLAKKPKRASAKAKGKPQVKKEAPEKLNARSRSASRAPSTSAPSKGRAPNGSSKTRSKRTAEGRGELSGEDEEGKGEKERLTYGFKEGQRHKTPPIGDGTRAFYESTFEENPNSLMATRWCIEHGILSGTVYFSTLDRYKKLKLLGAFKGGVPGGVHPLFANGIPPKMLKELDGGKSPRR